jgi:putative tryptophan/tyrosine transport system substrate-binding protein
MWLQSGQFQQCERCPGVEERLNAVSVHAGPLSVPRRGPTRALQAAAETLSLQLRILHASTEREFDLLVTVLAEQHVGGLMIVTEPFFNN